MPLPSADKNFVDEGNDEGGKTVWQEKGDEVSIGISDGEDNPFTRGLLVPLFKSVLSAGVQPGKLSPLDWR